MKSIEPLLERKISPIATKQEYIWFGKYNDNSYIYEVDQDKKEMSFEEILQDKINEFGLIGNGLKLSFIKSTGNFNINGQENKVFITKDDVPLMFNTPKDIIQFKTGHTDGVFLGRKIQRYERFIDGYFFGYKTKIDNLHLQIVLNILVAGQNRRPFWEIKASNNKTTKLAINIGERKAQLELQPNKINTAKLFFF